jgi:hypothetical protein
MSVFAEHVANPPPLYFRVSAISAGSAVEDHGAALMLSVSMPLTL